MVAAFSTMVNLYQNVDPNLPAPAAAAPPPPPATTNWPWPRLKQKEHATAGNLTKQIEVSMCSTCGLGVAGLVVAVVDFQAHPTPKRPAFKVGGETLR